MHFSALITIDALKQNLRHKYKNKLLLTNSSVLFTLSLKISYWFWHCFWCSSTHYFRPRFRWFWINIRFYIDSSNIRYSGYRPSSNFWYNIWRSNCFCSPNIRYNFRSNCYIHSSSIWQYFRCSSLGFIKFIWSNNNKAKLFWYPSWHDNWSFFDSSIRNDEFIRWYCYNTDSKFIWGRGGDYNGCSKFIWYTNNGS